MNINFISDFSVMQWKEELTAPYLNNSNLNQKLFFKVERPNIHKNLIKLQQKIYMKTMNCTCVHKDSFILYFSYYL